MVDATSTRTEPQPLPITPTRVALRLFAATGIAFGVTLLGLYLQNRFWPGREARAYPALAEDADTVYANGQPTRSVTEQSPLTAEQAVAAYVRDNEGRYEGAPLYNRHEKALTVVLRMRDGAHHALTATPLPAGGSTIHLVEMGGRIDEATPADAAAVVAEVPLPPRTRVWLVLRKRTRFGPALQGFCHTPLEPQAVADFYVARLKQNGFELDRLFMKGMKAKGVPSVVARRGGKSVMVNIFSGSGVDAGCDFRVNVLPRPENPDGGPVQAR